MMPAGASEVDDRVQEAGRISSRSPVPGAHPACLANKQRASDDDDPVLVCVENVAENLTGPAPGLGVTCTGLLLHEDSKMGTGQELGQW